MIKSDFLEDVICKYETDCNRHNRSPSRRGLGKALGISATTINAVVRGEFRPGKPYTANEHPSRRVGNKDFEVVRRMFE